MSSAEPDLETLQWEETADVPKNATAKELRAEIARLRKLAYTDQLTGLYNRHGFGELAERFVQEVPLSRQELRTSVVVKDVSIALFDLDHFKRVNDQYGHDAGDAVLQAFAKIILKRIRKLDIAARWGGEEIIVAFVGASEEVAVRIANEIRVTLAETEIAVGEERIRVTTSCGVAGLREGGSLAGLTKSADVALYIAKEQGRNRVEAASEISIDGPGSRA